MRWLGLPSVGAVAFGVVLALLLLHASPERLPRVVRGASWVVDGSGAREVLSAALGVLLTAISISMSLLILTVQNVAALYSPRLFPLLTADANVHRVFPCFAGIATYLLVGIVGAGGPGWEVPLPRPIVSGGVLLLGIAGAMLTFQVNRTLRLVNLDVLMSAVVELGIRHARELHAPSQPLLPSTAVGPPPARACVRPLHARRSGFLGGAACRRLLRRAAQHQVCIWLERVPGTRLEEDERVGWIASDDRGPVSDATRVGIESSLPVVAVRGRPEDLALPVRQLTDIALRALSPGINDPHTAVCAVGEMTRLLLAYQRLLPEGAQAYSGPDGRRRVVAAQLTVGDCLRLFAEPVVHFGGGEPQVLVALVRLLSALDSARGATRLLREETAALRSRVREAALRNLTNATDRTRILALTEAGHGAGSGGVPGALLL